MDAVRYDSESILTYEFLERFDAGLRNEVALRHSVTKYSDTVQCCG